MTRSVYRRRFVAPPRRGFVPAVAVAPPAAVAAAPARRPIPAWALYGRAWTAHRARLARMRRAALPAPAVAPPAQPAVPLCRRPRLRFEIWSLRRWAAHRARLARRPGFVPRWTAAPPPVPEPAPVVDPIWLAEIEAYDPTIAGTRVLRYASGAGYNHPTAPGYYEPRIVQPANFRRDIFAEGTTGGRSRPGFGELVLANPPPAPDQEGPLDGVLDYGFDGRALSLKLVGRDAAYATAVEVLRGTAEQPSASWDRVSLRIRDRQQELEVPIQPAKFAGDNVLPDGVEGTQEDLAGKPKPIAYGAVFNAPLPIVNTSRLIYQCHDRRIAGVIAVRDKGVPLLAGIARATRADLDANVPDAGSFDYCLGDDDAGAYLRIGSAPAGCITADLQGDARGGVYRASVAAVAAEIVSQRGGIAGADIVEADIAALDAENDSAIGLWIDGERTIAAVLDELCASIGAWWGFDRLGRFRIKRFSAPAGPPALTLMRLGRGSAARAGDADILAIERVPTGDPGRGVPAWRVKLRHRRNWAPMAAADLAGAVSEADRARFAQEWLEVVSSDAAVQAKHRLAPQREFDSLLVDGGAAQTEADRLRDLFKVRRDRLKVTTRLGAALAEAVDLGAVVKLQLARFGYGAGRPFVVTGLDYDAASGVVTLDLWG